MATAKKTNGKSYRVLVALSDGKLGAYAPGETLAHEVLAEYVPEPNITALIDAGVIAETENGEQNNG